MLRRAVVCARDLGHPRVGSEHLLAALASDGGAPIVALLAEHGATRVAVQDAACAAAPSGAGAAADRNVLAAIGIDLDCLLHTSGTAPLDRPAGREPAFPLGVNLARRQCARTNPPLGIDAQASYAASLRLALARRERRHRCEHVALTLTSLDPGVDWVLTYIGVDRCALLADLSVAFPPPVRNRLARADRQLGHRSRHRSIVRLDQHLTGRTAIDGATVVELIAG